MAAALRMLPAKPFTADTLASVERSLKRGKAAAARIPRMTITMTSSMSVKPECFACRMTLCLLLSKSVNGGFGYKPYARKVNASGIKLARIGIAR